MLSYWGPSSLLDKVTRSLQSRMYNALRPGSWGHFGSEVRFEMPEITNEYRELVFGISLTNVPSWHASSAKCWRRWAKCGFGRATNNSHPLISNFCGAKCFGSACILGQLRNSISNKLNKDLCCHLIGWPWSFVPFQLKRPSPQSSRIGFNRFQKPQSWGHWKCLQGFAAFDLQDSQHKKEVGQLP